MIFNDLAISLGDHPIAGRLPSMPPLTSGEKTSRPQKVVSVTTQPAAALRMGGTSIIQHKAQPFLMGCQQMQTEYPFLLWVTGAARRLVARYQCQPSRALVNDKQAPRT